MQNSRIFDSIKSYNDFCRLPTLNPLVSVIDYYKVPPRAGFKATWGFYSIILKEVQCGDMVYGKQAYDYQEGTLVFFGPGQTVDGSARKEVRQPMGRRLCLLIMILC